MKHAADSATAIELILAEEPEVIARLEKELRVTQGGMVGFYIEVTQPRQLAFWIGGRGSAEERLDALRAFIRDTHHAGV